MTVATTSNKITYDGDGATTVFPFTFANVDAGDIEVYFTDADGNVTLLVSGYTVLVNAPIGSNPTGVGGSVTYPTSGSPIALGTQLTLYRSLDVIQDTSLANQGNAYPTTIEGGFDYLTMLTQQLNELLGRSIVVPISDPDPAPLPSIAQRASHGAIFDADGNLTAGDPPASGSISVAMQPVTSAATLLAARLAMQTNAHGPVFVTRTAAAAASIDTDIICIITCNYATSGDRGGAFYKVDVGSTTGGFQSADGRWWSLAVPVARPEMFGAKADGAINPATGAVTGTNDTQAIQDAINTTVQVDFTGGKIYVISDTIGNPVSALYANTSNHFMNGNGATLAFMDHVVAPGVQRLMIYFVGTALNRIQNIRFDRLNLYGNARNQGNVSAADSYNAYNLIYCDGLWVTNCKVNEVCHDGIGFGGSINVYVANNRVDKCGKDCIYAPGESANVTITGNTVSQSNWDFGYGPYFGGTGYAGIAASGVSACTVTGNTINQCGTGISAVPTGTPLSFSNFVSITGNEINTTAGPGISIQCNDVAVPHIGLITVSGNSIFSAGQAGIVAVNTTLATIAGNNIDGTGQQGIVLTACSEIAITGNTIISTTLSSIGLNGATNCVISGNETSGSSTYGVQFISTGAGTASNVGNAIGDSNNFRAPALATFAGVGTFESQSKLTLRATFAWNPGAIANGASASQTVAVLGARIQDSSPVTVGTNQVTIPGTVLSAVVTADDVVTVTAGNLSGAGINLANQTWRVAVQKGSA